jgi:hypothetical protein
LCVTALTLADRVDPPREDMGCILCARTVHTVRVVYLDSVTYHLRSCLRWFLFTLEHLISDLHRYLPLKSELLSALVFSLEKLVEN